MRPYLVRHGEALPEEGSGNGGITVRPFRSALLGWMLSLSVVAGSSSTGAGATGDVHSDLPETVDPARRHLFYIHGAWIEQHGLEHPHPRHGRYEYLAIVRALAERGFVVISEARKGDTDGETYAEKVVTQVRLLLERGVPPSQVTVIGHSKGGSIALIAASALQEEELNFVIMAGCGKRGSGFGRSFEGFLEERAARLRGRMLSIYDASDRVAGSCREAFEKAAIVESAELVLHTGRGHALFWSPRAVWVDEVVEWAEPKS
jgi:pimeloyl-ACP methyl ester carboxylesterase